jgi:hypothetical protein
MNGSNIKKIKKINGNLLKEIRMIKMVDLKTFSNLIWIPKVPHFLEKHLLQMHSNFANFKSSITSKATLGRRDFSS